MSPRLISGLKSTFITEPLNFLKIGFGPSTAISENAGPVRGLAKAATYVNTIGTLATPVVPFAPLFTRGLSFAVSCFSNIDASGANARAAISGTVRSGLTLLFAGVAALGAQQLGASDVVTMLAASAATLPAMALDLRDIALSNVPQTSGNV